MRILKSRCSSEWKEFVFSLSWAATNDVFSLCLILPINVMDIAESNVIWQMCGLQQCNVGEAQEIKDRCFHDKLGLCYSQASYGLIV